MLYLGADGGGTHTTLLLTDAEGRCLARVRAGGLNHHNIGLAPVKARLRAVLDALPVAGDGVALCVGSSALDGPAGDALTREYADGLLPAERLLLTSDLHAAVMGLALGAPALMVVSGTGSMAALLDAAGAVYMGGGWGATLHDDLSSYALAREGLLAAIRAWEGADPPTALCEAALAHFGVSEPRAILPKLYEPPIAVSALARFAVPVLQAAREGDPAAMGLVGREMAALAAVVLRLAEREPTVRALGLYGGVFQHNGWVRSAFARRLQQAAPRLTLTEAPLPPEAGAAALALQKDGLWNEAAAHNLMQTMEGCDCYDCQ